MREVRNAYVILVGKPEGGHHAADIAVDGWVMLEWIFQK
jgi:hypothetical protein